MSVDPTRLLVLGATRQEQPASGYAIMRELTGWGVREWASVNPGSIYGALRTFVKEGLAAETTEVGSTTASGRAHKNSTKYRLTDEGESTFADLLRSALREVDPYRPALFMVALCFLDCLSRDEITTALQERISTQESRLRQLEDDAQQKILDDTKPPHSVEFTRLAAARQEGERTFTRELLGRVHAGDYLFVGEE